MWKKFLIIPIVLFISPVIGGKRKKRDGQRTNDEAFRYCTRSCSSDSDCKSNQKCLCDEDCGMSCVRNNLKCEALSKAKNSHQKTSNGRAFLSVVTYTCKPPFKLRGSSKRTCRATGKWDGRKARCRIMCKDPGEISFGNRRVEGLQAEKYIQYWCFDNYYLVGSVERSVRIKCLETGEWSAPKPKCKRCQRTNQEAFRYCMKSCSSDSDCKSNQKCLCDEDCGMSCVRNNLKCEALSKAKNSRQKFSNGRSFNSVVTYSCKPPFKLRGSSKRTCRAIGKWDRRKPRCRIMCKDPGEISFGNRRVEGLQAGKYIQYWCFDYYNLTVSVEPSVRIKCLETGEWSAPKPKCEFPRCDPPKIPDSAFVYYPRRMKKQI